MFNKIGIVRGFCRYFDPYLGLPLLLFGLPEPPTVGPANSDKAVIPPWNISPE